MARGKGSGGTRLHVTPKGPKWQVKPEKQAAIGEYTRRLTTPADVAKALVALTSPNTHWMTGNVIGVDGGEEIAG